MLEALEGVAGVLGGGLRCDLRMLRIQLNDLRRRVPEHSRLIGLAQETLEGCEDDRGRAQALVAEVLAVLQEERSAWGSVDATEVVEFAEGDDAS